MDDDRTGLPEVDALIDAADRERDRFWGLTAMADAEGTLSASRGADLAELHKAARQLWSDAEGQLTHAQKDGDAAKIAAARERCDAAYTEYDAIAAKATAEMQTILSARLDRTGRQLDALQRAADADTAVLDALRRRPS